MEPGQGRVQWLLAACGSATRESVELCFQNVSRTVLVILFFSLRLLRNPAV
jgi:hypothetical protein